MSNMLSVSRSKKKGARPLYRNWTEEAMLAAVADVKQNGISIRKADEKYSVPPTTLNNRTTGNFFRKGQDGVVPLCYLRKMRWGCWKMPKRAELGVGYSKSSFLDVHLNLRKKEGHSLRVQYHQKCGGGV